MLATALWSVVACAVVTPPSSRCGDGVTPAKCDETWDGDTSADTGADTAGDTATDSAGDTGAGTGDTLEPLIWPAGCDDRGATSRDGLLVAWTWHGGGLVGFEGVEVVDDADRWEELVAAWEGVEPAAPVDFATDVVVVAAHAVSSTCGAGVEDHGAWLVDGAPFVWVRFYDTTGTCMESCDIGFESVVAYAVPRGVDPVACVESHDTCE